MMMASACKNMAFWLPSVDEDSWICSGGVSQNNDLGIFLKCFWSSDLKPRIISFHAKSIPIQIFASIDVNNPMCKQYNAQTRETM